MATKLNLYHDCKITRDRNARIDSISDYLSSVATTTYSATAFPIAGIDIQYQQIDLHKKLKLDLSQAQVGKQAFNYLKIYQDNKNFYYFIDKANWKSTSTVEFDITLDTVNTFASDFTFNKKTRILRQHKNRMILTGELAPFDDYLDENDPLPVGYKYVLNPWAYENEVHDTFGVFNITEDNYAKVKIYEGGVLKRSLPFIVSIEQKYLDEGGVAMVVTSHLHDITVTDVLKYDDLIREYQEEDTYYVFELGDNFTATEDFVYTAGWSSLFLEQYKPVYKRIVDKQPEEIQPPLFKEGEQDILEESGVSWNLVYKSKNQYDPSDPSAFDKDNAIEVYLYPSDNLNIKVPGSSHTVNVGDLSSGTYYYVLPKVSSSIYGNDDFTITDSSGNEITKIYGTRVYQQSAWTGTGVTTDLRYAIVYKSGSDIKVEYWNFHAWSGRNSTSSSTKVGDWTGSSIKLDASFDVAYNSKTTYYNNYSSIISNLSSMTHSTWSTGATVDANLNSIEYLDRTDSRLLKIIELPYPFLTVSNNEISSKDWIAVHVTDQTPNHYALKLKNPNAVFSSTFKCDYQPLSDLVLEDVTINTNANRNDKYESKIYNSQFYEPKFVYDAFSYIYNLENVDINRVSSSMENNIKYDVTTTLNSKFMFTLDVPLDRSVSDYDNICLVSRNNERTILNSTYINYIRSGYNYDLKAKELQARQRTTSIASSAITSMLGGAALGALKGTAAAGFAGAAIGAVGGIIAGVISTAYQQQNADNNIKQKLDEASRQAVSVSGSDDVDLLRVYTNGNRAKYVTYSCSEKMKQAMYDLFYYAGYADNVQAIPSLNTRTWFNFIQCEAVFNEANNHVYQEYIEDLKERYKEGVTVYHRVNNSYDFDQTKENWETSL